MDKVKKIFLLFLIISLFNLFLFFINLYGFFLIKKGMNKNTSVNIEKQTNSDKSNEIDEIKDRLLFLENKVKEQSDKIDLLPNNDKSIQNNDSKINKISEFLEKKRDDEIIKKRISFDYDEIFGPFDYDDGFIIFFPDGSYEIFDKFGNSLKKGKISNSIVGKPIFDNKIFYFCDNSGNLNCYDLVSFNKMWKSFVGMSSKIDIMNLNDFILFSTPDKNNSIIHKKSGVIILKKYFEWTIYPFTFKNNIYFVTKDYINIFSHEMKEIKKIKNSFASIDNIFSFETFIIVKSNNKIFKCDENIVYGNEDIFDNFYKYNNTAFLIEDKKIYKYSETPVENLDYENNIIYWDKNYKVEKINDKYIVKNKENEFLVDSKEEIKSIYSKEKFIVIIDKKHTLSYWRVD